MQKSEDKLSSAEDALLDTLDTLFALIQEYERGKYARTKSTPAEMLTFLMEENNLSPADLPVPASRVSEITSGKREVSKEQAKRLGAFFRVSPAFVKSFEEHLLFFAIRGNNALTVKRPTPAR